MLKRTLLRSDLRCGPAFNPPIKDPGWRPSRFHALPAVPVLTETLLLLDLQTHQPSIDLTRVAQLILGDVGACLQILRLAGQEYSDFQGPLRIEDCISDLGIDRCLEAMSIQVSKRDPRYDKILAMWTHSRQVANFAKSLAEKSADFNALPEQAYLVGLLHTLGALPRLLDWRINAAGQAGNHLAYTLSEQWSLPEFISDFFRELDTPGILDPWSDIVRKAHEGCTEPCVDCGIQKGFRAALPRGSSATLHPMPRSG